MTLWNRNPRSKKIKIAIMKHGKKIKRECRNQSFKISLFSFLIALLFNAGQINAQVPKDLSSVKTGTVNAGSLLSQFMSGVKPSSFTDGWKSEKGSWLSSVSKIASAPGMIEHVSSLTKFIKPSMFKDAFKPENLLQTATTAKSMTDAVGLLKNLEGGLKPEAMVSSWAGKKSSWLSALSLLK